MLSKEVVENFLEGRLGMKDWKAQLNNSKLDFIFELHRRFKRTIYYQNFSYAKPTEELTTPTIESSIFDVTQTPGAACIQLNHFTQELLEYLGYDAFLVAAPISIIAHPNNHMAVIVRVSKTELFMIENGLPWPVPEIVNLNKLPHVTRIGGFEIEYRFNESKKLYERVFRGGDPIKPKGKFESQTDEVTDISFDLNPRKFDHFIEAMRITFTEPQTTFFLNTSFILRFSSLISNEDFEYIVCFARSIIIGNPDSRQILTYETYPEMIPDILKYFPEMDREQVEEACGRFETRRLKGLGILD